MCPYFQVGLLYILACMYWDISSGVSIFGCFSVTVRPSGVFKIWERGHGERAEREPIRGSGGGAPSGVQGQSPWSGGQGAKLT